MDKSIKWKVGIILVVLFFEAIWLLIMLYARSYGFEVEFNAGYILFALLILDTHLYAYILVKDLYYNKYSPIAFVFLLITSIPSLKSIDPWINPASPVKEIEPFELITLCQGKL